MARKSYRRLVLELDPKAQLHGPKWFGHFKVYWVTDGNGIEIGYSDGNENAAGWAWLRAYATLKRRAEHGQARRSGADGAEGGEPQVGLPAPAAGGAGEGPARS